MIQATLRTNYFVDEPGFGPRAERVVVQAQSRADRRTSAARGRSSRSSCTRRGSRVCTCGSASSPAAACGGRIAARTSAPRSSAWSRRRRSRTRSSCRSAPRAASSSSTRRRPPAIPPPTARRRGRRAWPATGCSSPGLLDVTDNVDKVTGAIVTPSEVVRRDGDDAYLVVAADKGTATFSDIANEVAKSYGFWLGDAFASGGSVGYDHKAMGITAKGAWESVKRHFREMGVDTQSEDFTVVGVGDMSGDVFGNGMLLSEAHPAARRVRPPAHLHRPQPRRRDVVAGAQAPVRPAAVQLGGLRPLADQRGRRGLQPRAEVHPDQPRGPHRARHRGRGHRADTARADEGDPEGARRPAVQRRHRHLHQGRDRVGRRRRRPCQRRGPGERKPGARQGDRRGRQPRRDVAGPHRVRPRRRAGQHRRDGQLRGRGLLRPRGEHQDPDRLPGHRRQGRAPTTGPTCCCR